MAAPTLYEVLVAIGYELRDSIEGTTNVAQASPTLMKDTLRAARAGDFDGSEVLFLDVTGLTGNNPKQVLSSAADGTFTLKEAYGAAGAGTGLRYALFNHGGMGYPYAQRLDALKGSIENLNSLVRTTVTLPTLDDTTSVYGYDFNLTPTGLDSLYAVEYYNPTSKGSWFLRGGNRGLYRIDPATRILNLNFQQSSGYALRLYGRTKLSIPAGLTATIGYSRQDLVQAAVEWLTLSPQDRLGAALSGQLYMQRVRQEGLRRVPGEVLFV